MSQQRLHSQLAPIDLLTREELEQELHKQIDAQIRELVRGLDIFRFPVTTVTASATPTLLSAPSTGAPCGPEQGDIWMVRRVIVKSSGAGDQANYVLYRGSTPSDTTNATASRYLLDAVNPPTSVPAPSNTAPSVGTSPWTYVNPNPFTVNVTITGGTVSVIAVNGQTTGATSGTFALGVGQYLTITYTVAPTVAVANAAATGVVSYGQHVNTAWYPGTKSVFLYPGEQIYANILAAVTGNVYHLDGEGIRVPAEMRGKVL